MPQRVVVAKLNTTLAIAKRAAVLFLRDVKRDLRLKIANLGIHGYLAIVVINLTPIQHKAPSRQVEEVHGFSSRRCWRRLRYVGAPVLVDRKMDHGAIDYDFLQIDLAPPERNKPQAHGEMVHPEQWRVGIKRHAGRTTGG